MDVDADAMDVYSNDIPDARALYPCTIKADDLSFLILIVSI
jgi:hypothetical protein